MMGTTLPELLELADTCNLNTDLHGTTGKYDEFNLFEARAHAEYLRRSVLWRYDVILACGREVCRALDFPDPGYDVRHYAVPGGDFVTHPAVYGIPHPGGTNHWWNDPTNREQGTTIAGLAWAAANYG